MNLLVVCVFAGAVFALSEAGTVNIQTEDNNDGELRPENCDFPKHSPFRRECALFKCSKDGARVLVIPCPYSPCPSKLSYNEEEFPTPYPQCCAPTEC